MIETEPRITLDVAPNRSTVPEPKPRILVVDDEETVREVVKSMLSFFGHEVAAAVASGAEALKALRDEEELFDLVLTDVAMPGMTGPQLVEEIENMFSKHDDQAPAIAYITGDSSQLKKPVYPVLEKPVTLDGLEEFITTVLPEAEA